MEGGGREGGTPAQLVMSAIKQPIIGANHELADRNESLKLACLIGRVLAARICNACGGLGCVLTFEVLAVFG